MFFDMQQELVLWIELYCMVVDNVTIDQAADMVPIYTTLQ